MQNSFKKFTKEFEEKLERLDSNYSNIVFLCVGTNKLSGDCIGPVVGSYLKEIQSEFIHIYGTIEKNLNFFNARKIIKHVHEENKNPYIITIDAALSKKNNKGDIVLSTGYIKIGKALQKNICFYSNINIKCVVGNCHNTKEENLEELKQVNLTENLQFAKNISTQIKNVLEKSNIYV